MVKHLKNLGWKVARKPWRNYSQPDAITRFFLFSKIAWDAKAKAELTYLDVDKLARDMREHSAGEGMIYVCSLTLVRDGTIAYAKSRGIRIVRLFRNGYTSLLD